MKITFECKTLNFIKITHTNTDNTAIEAITACHSFTLFFLLINLYTNVHDV
jgi:hypothetical protein